MSNLETCGNCKHTVGHRSPNGNKRIFCKKQEVPEHQKYSYRVNNYRAVKSTDAGCDELELIDNPINRMRFAGKNKASNYWDRKEPTNLSTKVKKPIKARSKFCLLKGCEERLSGSGDYCCWEHKYKDYGVEEFYKPQRNITVIT